MTSPHATTPPLLIGCAAGFSGDRIDAAGPVVQELIRQRQPAVLIFETLAEHTLALAQLARRSNPEAGFEPLMPEFLRPVLADCLQHGIRIVSNFGAANPQAAARTIHRLLEYTPKDDGFARNEDNPLACGLLVVDEASMMDTMLAYHLLKAAPLGATIVFVGDVHQLPSVGPGNVLGDLIASGAMPVVELVEVFRQAAESEIVCNAHLINRGELPRLESSKDRLSDFYFMRQDDPDRAADIIVDLVKNHIPRRFQLDPFDEIQVLSPMHKGTVGAANLNLRLQQALNPEGEALQRGERLYRLGDKVMQIRNNYEKDVYNGDIGRVSSVDVQEKCLVVRYDDRYVGYDWEELDEIVAAYAISIHKSQGSEYPAVVIPLMTQHYMLLQRNLIYTGVTRGKLLVVLVGEPRALAMAVKNNRMQKRYTWLARRLGAAPEAVGSQTEGGRA